MPARDDVPINQFRPTRGVAIRLGDETYVPAPSRNRKDNACAGCAFEHSFSRCAVARHIGLRSGGDCVDFNGIYVKQAARKEKQHG